MEHGQIETANVYVPRGLLGNGAAGGQPSASQAEASEGADPIATLISDLDIVPLASTMTRGSEGADGICLLAKSVLSTRLYLSYSVLVPPPCMARIEDQNQNGAVEIGRGWS